MSHQFDSSLVRSPHSKESALATAARRRRVAQAVVEALENRRLFSTITVTTLVDTTNYPTSVTISQLNATPVSFRDAINAVNNTGGNDTINFAASLTAGGPATITLNGSELLLNDTSGTLTIDGPAANLLTISGNNANRVFEVASGSTAAIDGVTITGGNGAGNSGGAILSHGALTIAESTISGNSAGGAGYGYGGAIYEYGSNLTLQGCTIASNSGGWLGGGIFAGSTNLKISDSTITGNSARYGGAMYTDFDTATISDSTISGNTANLGSAIYGYRSNNTLQNTILTGSTSTFGTSFSGSYNLLGPGITVGGSHNIVESSVAAVGLGTLGNYGGPTQTIPVLAGSPAINAGSNSLAVDGSGNALTTDQRGIGYARQVGGVVDIGAFEVQTLSVTANTTNRAASAATLTIAGSAFDPTAANDSVTFNNGAVGTVTSATPGTLTVTLTTAPTAGALTAVVTADGSSSGSPVQVATIVPVVTSSTANLAANATSLTIGGVGFDPTIAHDSVVFNDGAVGSVTAATATSLTISLSSDPTSAGSLTAVVTTNSQSSGSAVQVAAVVPVVTSSTANLAANATSLSIAGVGFDPTIAHDSVVFNDGAVGSVTAATPTSLTVSLSSEPTSAGSLTAVVTTNSQSSGSAVQVATVVPVVTSSSTSLPITATSVTIAGFGFDPTIGNDAVVFNDGAVGQVTSANSNSLTVTFSAPPASTGSLVTVVTVDGVSSGAPVQVATVTAVSPTVTTPTQANLTSVTATLGGDVTSDGSTSIIDRGVLYSLTSVNANPTIGGTGVTEVDDAASTTGTFTENVANLSENSAYTYVAFATNGVGTSYSPVDTFQTQPTLVVNTAGDPNTPVDGDTSLREAIAYADSLGGDQTISFDPTLTANGPATITLNGSELDLDDPIGTLTIDGPGANLLTIDGNNASRVLSIVSHAAIDGVTITGGNPHPHTLFGGAVLVAFATATITDSTITGNANTDPTSGGYGGGIYAYRSSLNIQGCTISSNSAFYGGGIHAEQTSLVISNSTITGNTARNGGAIAAYFGTLAISDSTITGNTATSGSAGITGDLAASYDTINNTILTDGTPPYLSSYFGGSYDILGPSVAVTGSNNIVVSDAAAVGLGALGNYGGPTETIPLLSGSPAINAGSNSLAVDINGNALTTDQRGVGFGREIAGVVDIGADEFQSITVTPDTAGLANSATTLTIAGIGFDPTAANDSVVFNDGAVGTVTSASVGSLTVTFTTAPTIGGLTAIVTSDGTNSGAAVQVANVFAAPTVTTPTQANLTNTDVTLGGDVTSDGGSAVITRGVLYSLTAVNANPTIGGAGVTEVDDASATTGTFTENVTNLPENGADSYVAFATNAAGTSYTPVDTFQTQPSLIVNTTSDPATAVDGFTSLREAIAYADTLGGNQTISFDPSLTASGPATITLNGSELLLNDTSGTVTIDGPAADLLTISGNHASRVFDVAIGSKHQIDGVTITDGRSSDGGAGIRDLGTLTISNSTLTGNTDLPGNGRSYGGAIYASGPLTVQGCTISSNQSKYGGAIFSRDAQLTISDSTIAGNTAQNLGGAIWKEGGALAISDSTITGNTARSDDGILAYVVSATLNNTILTDSGSGYSSTLSGSYNILGPNTGVTGSNNIVESTVAAVGLGTLGNFGGTTQTIPLLPGSPAIDAGSNALAVDGNGNALTTDQRGAGFQRTIGASVDVGAYETPGFTIAATTGSGQSTSAGSAFATSLGVHVTANDSDLTDLTGGMITLTAPSSGAGATFSSAPIVLDSSGDGSTTATANNITGIYTVSASAGGVANSATFSLTNLVTALATPTVTVSDTGGVYNGSAYPATALVAGTDANPVASLEGVTPTVAYYVGSTATGASSSTAPTDAGTYTVVASFAGSTDYTAAVSLPTTFTISHAPVTVSLSNLTQTYDGSAKLAAATTAPDQISTTILYRQHGHLVASPTEAGSYGVFAFVNDANYSGSTHGTLVIQPANVSSAIVTMSNLSQTYDGSPKSAVVSTTPSGLATTITYSQNGQRVANPTNAGSYDVSVTVNNPDYTGSTTSTLVIHPQAIAITLGDLSQTYDGTARLATASTTPGGIATEINYSQNADRVTTPIGAGTYDVSAVASDPNYSGSASGTLVVDAASPILDVAGSTVTYDGAPHAGTGPAMGVEPTTPANLTPLLQLSYQDIADNTVSAAAPVYPGTYDVLARFDGNANYKAIPLFNTGKTIVINPFASLVGPSIYTQRPTTRFAGKVSRNAEVAHGVVTVELAGVTQTVKIRPNRTFSTRLSTANLPVGSYTVNYTYSGPGRFRITTWSRTLAVTYKTTPQFDAARHYPPGSIIPVAVKLANSAGDLIADPQTTLTAVGIAHASSHKTVLPLPAGTPAGGAFALDPRTGSYDLNLSTMGLHAGKYLLYFTASGDPITHAVKFIIA